AIDPATGIPAAVVKVTPSVALTTSSGSSNSSINLAFIGTEVSPSCGELRVKLGLFTSGAKPAVNTNDVPIPVLPDRSLYPDRKASITCPTGSGDAGMNEAVRPDAST